MLSQDIPRFVHKFISSTQSIFKNTSKEKGDLKLVCLSNDQMSMIPMKDNPTIDDYVQILVGLPVELQQVIIAHSLTQLDDGFYNFATTTPTTTGPKDFKCKRQILEQTQRHSHSDSHSHNDHHHHRSKDTVSEEQCCGLYPTLRFVALPSDNPQLAVRISLYTTTISMIISDSSSGQLTTKRVILHQKPNEDINHNWIEHLSSFKLVELKVDAHALDLESSNRSHSHKSPESGICGLVVLILMKFGVPDEFILDDFFAGSLFSDFLDHGERLGWLNKVTQLHELHQFDVETLVEQLRLQDGRFAALYSVSFDIFNWKKLGSQVESFQSLLPLVDHLVFKLRSFSGLTLYREQMHPGTVWNTETIARDEQKFFTFLQENNPKVSLKIGSINKCGLWERVFAILENAKSVSTCMLTSPDVYPYADDISRTLSLFTRLSQIRILRSLTISLSEIGDITLILPYVTHLKIKAKSINKLNLSKMTNLRYFGVITDGMLDHETMNTIPKSVRDLEIRSDYSPMVYKYNLPPFLQTLRTGPELLGHFHFSHEAVVHIDTLKLDINRFDEIYEDYPTWKFVPSTINLVYIKYYNTLLIPRNDTITTSLLTQRMARLRDQFPIPLQLPIPKIGGTSPNQTGTGYTENKMFGMSIPETVPSVEIVLQFMEEDPKFLNSSIRINTGVVLISVRRRCSN
ncbi:unnamed protein product [Ambrosiozyma monospora]|uniref:Unnamed protein product n=1 Tax=Ambrosiozyma monospora TaxID=43982 RepID=A0ACB5SXX9_AMBMO|nr:unnamed protein product [Ambrosiozyma monospora]